MRGYGESSLQTAQAWLDGQTSMNTQRKYGAQFQQFCEWSILHGYDLTSIDAAGVGNYLVDVSIGQATLNARWPGKLRGPGTVALARSVLRSLFSELIRAGHRPDNPADLAKLPGPATKDVKTTESRNVMLSWVSSRAEIVERTRSQDGERSALIRAVAIAELAWWAGLRRSELAAAMMGDFRNRRGKLGPWSISVNRFGLGRVDVIEVPVPAMQALSAYRINRGLTPWPSSDETGVPLISRLRSEHAVDPWTVAGALNDLMPGKTADPTDPRAPSILALRRELTLSALCAEIPAEQLARHVRSKRLVDQMAAQLSTPPIAGSLERLIAYVM